MCLVVGFWNLGRKFVCCVVLFELVYFFYFSKIMNRGGGVERKLFFFYAKNENIYMYKRGKKIKRKRRVNKGVVLFFFSFYRVVFGWGINSGLLIF